jgi:nitroreductase
MPFFMKYIYKILLGPKLGPLSGKMGIMNRESKIFRKNLMASGALIGVFHKKQKERSNYASLIDTGAMLQNLRLCATALGLAYQDQGWITATGSMREKVRELFKMPAEYQPINFFRIGRADKKKLINQDKQSAFRRSLETIVHYNLFNNKNNKHQYFAAKGLLSIFQNTDYDNSISDIQINQIIEAARWSPTGFNVQPFEYVILNESGFIKTILKDKAQANDCLLLVIENHLRQDPDPGPCEILARGAVLQNIRLVAKDIGILITEIPFNKTNVSNNENPVSREILSAWNIPEKYSLTFMLSLKPFQ